MKKLKVIAMTVASSYPKKNDCNPVRETIYAFIYRAAQRAEQLWRYLTRRHKRRRARRSRPSQDTIKDRVSIHERPKTVDGRTEGGHWEGDLIICKRTRPVLVLHERKSRVTLV